MVARYPILSLTADMEYSPKYKQPFTFAQACKLDVPTITKEIERLENSLFHLDRTQAELKEHLTGSPDEDREFLTVIKENDEVIASQKERITMLKLALEGQGVNTKSGHYDSNEPDGEKQSTTPLQTQTPTTTGNGNSRQGEIADAEERDDGVYL